MTWAKALGPKSLLQADINYEGIACGKMTREKLRRKIGGKFEIYDFIKIKKNHEFQKINNLLEWHNFLENN